MSKTSKAQKQHNLFTIMFIAELIANEDLLVAMVHFFIEKEKWPIHGVYGAGYIPSLFTSSGEGRFVPNRKLRKYEMDALKAVVYNKNKYWKMYIGIKEFFK